jgi:FkbM family methyltransferase
MTESTTQASALISVRIRGTTFRVAEAHRDFWERVSQGTWEPDTFELFDRFITPATTVLDVGGWIGPTAIYAAHRAKQVYAFEPDPVAFALLEANRAVNPELTNLATVNAAVSADEGEAVMGAQGEAGNSMSSLLFDASAERWAVRTLRLDRFLAERQVTGPLFVKVDVEGFEYSLLPALVAQLAGYDYTALVSLHPSFLWAADYAKDPRNSLDARVARRTRFVRSHWRLLRAATRYARVTDTRGATLPALRTALAVLRGRKIVPDDTLILTSR